MSFDTGCAGEFRAVLCVLDTLYTFVSSNHDSTRFDPSHLLESISALQLPPEAWLRYCPFNCSLTYLTIRPTGTVSCRMLGDIGHLPYNASTFSGHHGYNW